MKNSLYVSAVGVVALCAVAVWVLAAPLRPIEKDAWSKPVANLSGRILVAKEQIEPSGFFQLVLELRNTGSVPLGLQTEDPFSFTAEVLDGAGKTVKATLSRSDVLSSPQWAVVPRNCCLSFPVSIKSMDGAKGSHLDITTLIWKLSPAKYRITSKYSSDSFGDFKQKPDNVTIWRGKLVLPPVDVEIEKGE